MEVRKEIRVFVSSPGDCAAERDAVSRVLDELNRTVGDRERLFFIALRWEELPPGLGNGPQAVIDQQLGEYNILIGIMWLRFGTPIPGGAGSGTEHEVQQAIESWKRIGQPRVMFYFKDAPPTELSQIDADQLKEVRNFRKRLQSIGLIHPFLKTADFESHLRVHLQTVIAQLTAPAVAARPTGSLLPIEPYNGFDANFREVISAQRMPETGAILHVVFGNLADVREIPPVIPVGQAFDFRQRGPRSVLASFEGISIAGCPFFEAVENSWPSKERPKAAGLGHTKYLAIGANTQDLPGVCFVVTTRDLSTSAAHYGRYTNTPIEGIDYIIDQVTQMADEHRLSAFAMPLLGTGYANVRQTNADSSFGTLLKRIVTLLTIQKLQSYLQRETSSVKRAVIVIYSLHPHGDEEDELWTSVTQYIGSVPERRHKQIQKLINEAEQRSKKGPATAARPVSHHVDSIPYSRVKRVAESAWSIPDLCAAYDWPTQQTGGGVIGIVELAGGWAQSDLDRFFALIGQPVPNVTDVSVDGTTNNPSQYFGRSAGPDIEVALDIEIAAASYCIATGKPAEIRVYWAKDIARAVRAAIKDQCDVCSISWGADEAIWGAAAAHDMEAAACEATSAGMIVLAGSGDNDSGDGGATPANVDVPSSCPHVIACGATSKTKSTEVVWNNNPGATNGEGTCGGYSTLFPVQSWQIGAPTGPGRMVPDVSAGFDPNRGCEVVVHGQTVVAGGTGAVAPLYAGLFASFGRKLGWITPTLWRNPTCFNNITQGDNGFYRAQVGPDPCTGMGTPIGTKLASLSFTDDAHPGRTS